MISFAYIDNDDCLDPATNLAMEEYVLRQMDPDRNYLMFYRNEPSVIVGRNQNILEEINDSYVREKGIHVLRRLSGGGTVYHDYGNLNFSFVTRYEKSRLHNFRFFNEPVIKVLHSMGVPARMNDRNDILADGKKISGNAQFSSRGRMFSHGTLLFDSKLDVVNRTLAVKIKGIQSKSHKSVRSVVANISDFINTPMTILEFRDMLLDGLRNEGVIEDHFKLTAEDRQQIRDICKERYSQWDWNIGRSPRFQIERTRTLGNHQITIRLEVEKGVIQNLSLYGHSDMSPDLMSALAALGSIFTGLRYEPGPIDNALQVLVNSMLAQYISISDLRQLIYEEVPV